MKPPSFEISIRRSLVLAAMISLSAFDNPLNGFLQLIPAVQAARGGARPELTFKGLMPELSGGVAWVNSSPLTTRSLRGRVVLINFWTYTCINSLRALPYAKEWAAKYNSSGLVVIGVHTPEFSFEKMQANVQTATREQNVSFPVVMDNNYEIWRAFSNEYWPAFYLIDAKGRIRYEQFGEGNYVAMELAIRALLKENGSQSTDLPVSEVLGRGIEDPPSADERSPRELYRIPSCRAICITWRIESKRRKSLSPAFETQSQSMGIRRTMESQC
jgi:thiol-disulfide isomerase/thioredoxin